MKCDVCKDSEATVHLTQIINGKMQKVDLCEACAKTKGVSDPTSFSLSDMFMGLGHGESNPESEPLQEPKCTHCGMTQTDFKKSGRLGCSLCYHAFAEGLNTLLKSIHKGERHIGKIPTHFLTDATLSEQLKSLRKELEIAVKGENFEAAADFRDRIKKIEQQLKRA